MMIIIIIIIIIIIMNIPKGYVNFSLIKKLWMGAVADDQKWFSQLENERSRRHAAVCGRNGEPLCNDCGQRCPSQRACSQGASSTETRN